MASEERQPVDLTNGNLIRWRLDQVEKRLDNKRTRLDDLNTRVIELEEWRGAQDGRSKSIEDKLDSANNWLRGVMGALVLALVMLIANLLTQRQASAPAAAPKVTQVP